MRSKLSTYFQWAARVILGLIIVYTAVIVFVSYGFTADALAASLIWFIMLALLLVALRWEGWGGLLSIIFGVLYISITRDIYSPATYLLTALPLILSGIFFVIAKYTR